MNGVLVACLAVLAVILCSTRETADNARTWSELWAPARANGWKRGTLLAIGGVGKLLLLIAGCLITLAFAVVAHAGHGLWIVSAAIAAHLSDLLAPAPLALPRSETR
ncbi:hypothetical protein AB0L65_33290 [Nonomuraea sp. NPDC052116]|uniref:hypothetical protein n=1 Tax=Nonomuraea sp. NPDC052116 TaxID=3155665 RepID=UPI00342C0EB7